MYTWKAKEPEITNGCFESIIYFWLFTNNKWRDSALPCLITAGYTKCVYTRRSHLLVTFSTVPSFVKENYNHWSFFKHSMSHFRWGAYTIDVNGWMRVLYIYTVFIYIHTIYINTQYIRMYIYILYNIYILYIHTCMHACMHTYLPTYVRTYVRTYVDNINWYLTILYIYLFQHVNYI